jgi:hypothetical protein
MEEMLCPPAFADERDLDLHQLESHHLLVEVMDGGHVARREGEMMVPMTVSSQESTMRITSIAAPPGAATSVTRSSTSSYSRRSARQMVACIS